MTGMSRWPRLASACRAGKIFLWARSPVAPKNTSASDCSLLILRRREPACFSPRDGAAGPEKKRGGALDVESSVGGASRLDLRPVQCCRVPNRPLGVHPPVHVPHGHRLVLESLVVEEEPLQLPQRSGE